MTQGAFSMMPKKKWFDRRFSLELPAWMFTNIVERLRGTPARVEEMTRDLDSESLTHQVGDQWSIQVNVGHLSDLEPMWIGRIDDILRGEDCLRSTDLENRLTEEANHDANSLDALLMKFRELRGEFVRKLDELEEEDTLRSALHPRLEQPMRILDLAYFVAEHEDHHLATITSILKAPRQ